MNLSGRQRPLPAAIFKDERLMELPDKVRLTGIGLRFLADDQGRASATAALIRGGLWPLDQTVTDQDIDDHLLRLDQVGYLRLYAVGGRTYLVLADWPTVDRAHPSKLPPPPKPDPAEAGEAKDDEATDPATAWVADARATQETLAAMPEPSPFCAFHLPLGTTVPCGPCGSARKRHDQWVRAQDGRYR